MLEHAIFNSMNAVLARMNRPSLTSEKYRLDILERLYLLGDCGGGIIELGCCHGGFSCLLARACMETGRSLHIVDIVPEMLSEALDTVHVVNQEINNTWHGNVSGFCGSFLDFATSDKGLIEPAMIIVDAGHDFHAVYEDICVATVFYPGTKCVCFHDYALRNKIYPTNNAVDKAFHFIYGKNALFEPLGDAGLGVMNVTEWDAYYGIKGWPEGVAIWRNAISTQAKKMAIQYFEHEIRPLLDDKWELVEKALKKCFREDRNLRSN